MTSPNSIRVMTLNLAHGRGHTPTQLVIPGETAKRNLDAIGSVLTREEADVVALQEADGPSRWTGSLDHVDHLARRARYPHAFRGTHGGVRLGMDYGTALIGRKGLGAPRSFAFNRNWRDTKGFVSATVHLDGAGEIDVVSVHLDFLRDSIRRQQVELLSRQLAARHDRPLVIVGDLNCTGAGPESALRQLAQRLDLRACATERAPTFPSHRPRNRIDWVLVSRDLRFVSHRTLSDRVSDHLGIVAEIAPATERSHDHPVFA